MPEEGHVSDWVKSIEKIDLLNLLVSLYRQDTQLFLVGDVPMLQFTFHLGPAILL